jgi:probable O-glycosylation ligase (exosortase A-associated)
MVYAAFLAYVVAITTYRLPVGNLAVIAGLVGIGIQRDPIRLPPFLGWFAALIIWCAIGYVVTPYPQTVWDGLVDLIKLWLVVLVAANAIRTRAQIRLFVIVFLGCFALFPLRGALFNYIFYHGTLVGRAVWNFVYANPNDLAAVVILPLSMVAAFLAVERHGALKRAAQVGLVLLPLLVLMTQSRGGFVALLFFAVCCIVGQWGQFRKVIEPRRRLRLAIMLLVAMGGVAFFAPSGVWARLSGLRNLSTTPAGLAQVDEEGSARQRYEIWKVAAKIARENPLTGVGITAYPLAHAAYAQGAEFDQTAAGARDTHSTMLNLLAETGVPGTLIFVGLVASTLLGAERIRRRHRWTAPRQAMALFILEMGLLAFMVAGIFGSLAYLAFFHLHVVLLWAWSQAVQTECGPIGIAEPRVAPARREAWRGEMPRPSSRSGTPA